MVSYHNTIPIITKQDKKHMTMTSMAMTNTTTTSIASEWKPAAYCQFMGDYQTEHGYEYDVSYQEDTIV